MRLVDEEEALPFVPGTSPFRIKGIAYRGHVEYAEKHIPGGCAAVNAVFKNSALRFFFEQQFLAASWYDALPMVPLWYACAQVARLPRTEFLRIRTRHQAEEDIHGAYRVILKIASAETVALRIPRAVGQYFNFGTTEAKVLRRGVVHMEQAGVPMSMAPWLGIVGETFVQVALEIAGAKRIEMQRLAAAPQGTAHGVPLARLSGEVSFDTAAREAERSER